MGQWPQHLLQVDVVQVVWAADSLHHPTFWCDHVEGKEGRLGELQEPGGGTRRHRVIGHEGHVRFQDVSVKAAETHTEGVMSQVCEHHREEDCKQSGRGPQT